MIGHCGGLRPSQKIGDYVLAHAYLRDDHVLDPVLPPEIPLPADRRGPAGAGAGAAEVVSGEHGADLKKRMRTGTVVTTDDRNWELRYTASARRMSLSRAVGVDMESATIAGAGLPLPRSLRHAAVRLATSRSTAKSSCPARPTGSTKKRSPRTSRSASPPAASARRRRRAAQPQAARVQRAAVQVRRDASPPREAGPACRLTRRRGNEPLAAPASTGAPIPFDAANVRAPSALFSRSAILEPHRRKAVIQLIEHRQLNMLVGLQLQCIRPLPLGQDAVDQKGSPTHDQG